LIAFAGSPEELMFVCELWPSMPQAARIAFRETVFAGPADVIHDLLSAILDDGFADAVGDRVECLVPGRAFPLSGRRVCRCV
jgi:hypothetical protein